MSDQRLVGKFIAAALLAASVLLASAFVLAADVEVVEGQPDAVGLGTLESGVRDPVSTGRTIYRTQVNTPNDYQADSQTELLLQLQALQDEVRVLRGQLEEQAYLLEKVQQQSKRDYLEFDRRLSQSGSTATAKIVASATPKNATKNQPLSPRATDDATERSESDGTAQPSLSTQVVATTTSIATSNDNGTSENGESDNAAASAATDNKTDNVIRTESRVITTSRADDEGREAYKSAYNMVKAREFDQARVAMIAFIDQYPNNTFVPNAHFWLGELYYHDSDLVRSRDQFAVLIDAFPEHRKVPDAKFKMAKVIHQLGDAPKAKRLLQSVVKDHGASRVAKPAREYLENSL